MEETHMDPENNFPSLVHAIRFHVGLFQGECHMIWVYPITSYSG